MSIENFLFILLFSSDADTTQSIRPSRHEHVSLKPDYLTAEVVFVLTWSSFELHSRLTSFYPDHKISILHKQVDADHFENDKFMLSLNFELTQLQSVITTYISTQLAHKARVQQHKKDQRESTVIHQEAAKISSVSGILKD